MGTIIKLDCKVRNSDHNTAIYICLTYIDWCMNDNSNNNINEKSIMIAIIIFDL